MSRKVKVQTWKIRPRLEGPSARVTTESLGQIRQEQGDVLLRCITILSLQSIFLLKYFVFIHSRILISVLFFMFLLPVHCYYGHRRWNLASCLGAYDDIMGRARVSYHIGCLFVYGTRSRERADTTPYNRKIDGIVCLNSLYRLLFHCFFIESIG